MALWDEDDLDGELDLDQIENIFREHQNKQQVAYFVEFKFQLPVVILQRCVRRPKRLHSLAAHYNESMGVQVGI